MLVFPDNAKDKTYTLTSSDPNIMRINDNNTFTAVSSGEAVITATAASGVKHALYITVICLDEIAAEVLRLTNIERAKHGAGAVSANNSTLNSAAAIRAQEVVSLWSHTRPCGRDPFTAFTDLGGTYRMMGENLAAGQRTPKEVVDAWMNSKTGHRETLLHPDFTHLGIGIVLSEGRFYWCQLFLTERDW